MSTVSATTADAWLKDADEIAFLDVREHGQYGEAHPLRVVWMPYSLLEARISDRVPRRSTRTLLLDAGDGVAERAQRRLTAMGYTDVHTVDGGQGGWANAGLEVYQGVNVPSKAFGEVVEHVFDTPRIEPGELNAMCQRGDKLVILDGRTPTEFHRMCIPGGMSVPNAELVYRIADIAPDPSTTVVVNCAGRTRSIIGAQTLINAGIANRVVALKGGTMAWRLAGLELDQQQHRPAPEVTADGLESAKAMAETMRERYVIPCVDADGLRALQSDANRTTYVSDVRSEDEYRAGHLDGARHAPGGQLVQATDEWCAVWGAHIVLVDEGSGVRATTTAHWLKQMGWSVQVLLDTSGLATRAGPAAPSAPPALPDGVSTLDAAAAKRLVDAGNAVIIDVDDSAHYLARRLPGAHWAPRARVQRTVDRLQPGHTAIVYSEHETRARLALRDLAESGDRPLALLGGGREAWCAAGLPTETATLDDTDRIDFLFWVHDRHLDNDQAARDYLTWEENLPAQLERSNEPPFPLVR